MYIFSSLTSIYWSRTGFGSFILIQTSLFFFLYEMSSTSFLADWIPISMRKITRLRSEPYRVPQLFLGPRAILSTATHPGGTCSIRTTWTRGLYLYSMPRREASFFLRVIDRKERQRDWGAGKMALCSWEWVSTAPFPSWKHFLNARGFTDDRRNCIHSSLRAYLSFFKKNSEKGSV